jgi:hypothetical protein
MDLVRPRGIHPKHSTMFTLRYMLRIKPNNIFVTVTKLNRINSLYSFNHFRYSDEIKPYKQFIQFALFCGMILAQKR